MLLTAQTVSFATPTAAELETQIDQKWNAIEPIIEKYNAVSGQLAAGQKQVAALQAQIQPLAVQVDLAETRVGVISAEMYINGAASTGLNTFWIQRSAAEVPEELGFQASAVVKAITDLAPLLRG